MADNLVPKKMGRPVGSPNKTKQYAEALMGYNGNKIVREVLRKALDSEDKDQAMMLKICLERILPPVREVNIKSQKQTSVSVVIEGIQAFSREIGNVETLPELEYTELDVESTIPEEAYEEILEEPVDDE